MKKQAVVALIRQNDKILCVSRKGRPDDFNLPGGKVDPGETLLEAIIREIREETGLIVDEAIPVFEDMRVDYTVTSFIVTAHGGLHTEEDHKIAWLEPSSLATGCFASYNMKLLAKMGYL